MKKAIVFSLMVLTLGIIAPASAEAKTSVTAVTTAETSVVPQRWGRRRSVTRTRIVWRFGRRYREVYRITYLPNGRTRVTVISRTRLRY